MRYLMRHTQHRVLFAVFFLVITASCGQNSHSGQPAGIGDTPSQTVAPQDINTPGPTPVPDLENNTLPTKTSVPASPEIPDDHNDYQIPMNPSNPPDADPTPTPYQSKLFVVISGNGSCNSRRDSRVLPGLWRTDLFDHFGSQVMGRGMVGPDDEMIFICYESRSPGMYFQGSKAHPTMVHIHETQLDSLVLSRLQYHRKLVVIGYSYGGWRAMKLASSPVLLRSLTVPTLLVTIDPISRMDCDGLFDSACHTAPRDFSRDEMSVLNRHTTWLNTFQKAALLIGSGPMHAAHQNLEFGGLHIGMARHSGVWDAIVCFLTKYL